MARQKTLFCMNDFRKLVLGSDVSYINTENTVKTFLSVWNDVKAIEKDVSTMIGKL